MNNTLVPSGLAICGLSFLLACQPKADPEHQKQVDAWHQDRIDRLSEPDGWLTLTGLYWLKPGDNFVGSAPVNTLRLPQIMPPMLGLLRVQENSVEYHAPPGLNIRYQEGPVGTQVLTMKTDATESPTVLSIGPWRLHLIERGESLGLRVKDANSPVRERFRGIERFPVDTGWRVSADFKPYAKPQTRSVKTVIDVPETAVVPGELTFVYRGQSYRLLPFQRKNHAGFFVVFADTTNGRGTYGGGRFLYTEAPVAGKVTLDFNRAYNPPCSFTAYSTCMVPPQENRLAMAVRAGEKAYRAP